MVVMVPAKGAGTSIVALSDITSQSDWPRATASPEPTSQRVSSTSNNPSPTGGSAKSIGNGTGLDAGGEGVGYEIAVR